MELEALKNMNQEFRQWPIGPIRNLVDISQINVISPIHTGNAWNIAMSTSHHSSIWKIKKTCRFSFITSTIIIHFCPYTWILSRDPVPYFVKTCKSVSQLPYGSSPLVFKDSLKKKVTVCKGKRILSVQKYKITCGWHLISKKHKFNRKKIKTIIAIKL